MNVQDFKERDVAGSEVFYVLLMKRNGISLELFDDYWKDVHGPVCARLPGQYQYWQFHLGHNNGGFWRPLDGVEYGCVDEDQVDGIAELTFRSPQDRDKWFSAASILMSDEHNLFSKAVGYVTNKGNSVTYIDSVENGAPNGDADLVKFHVLIRKSDATSVDKFRSYMTDNFVPGLLKSKFVAKLRVHLLEEHDNSEKLPPAPGVSHYEPPEKQYQAAVEIGFRDNMQMERFFASKEYADAMRDQSRYVKHFNAFPERNTYTFVHGGKMTAAGQRGAEVAKTIRIAGATNQLGEDILDLMLGKGVR